VSSPSPLLDARLALDRVSHALPDGRALFTDLPLGFGRERAALARPNGSGKTTLARLLAGALLAEPDVVVPDEPTNHLDLDGVAAVEGALADYDGALIVVSHDASLLEAIGVERTVAVRARG